MTGVKTTREGQASDGGVTADGSVRSERRAHLVVLAGELFAQKGYRATTVREIADSAGILSGSLYHHFDSKESMVEELLRTFLEDITHAYRLEVASGDDPVTMLRTLVRLAFDSIGARWATVSVMVNEYNLLI